MHPLRTLFDFTVRVDIGLVLSPGQVPVYDLHAANLDDPVAHRQARGFKVERDLAGNRIAHDPDIRAIASFARASARSFPSTPLWPRTQRQCTR